MHTPHANPELDASLDRSMGRLRETEHERRQERDSAELPLRAGHFSSYRRLDTDQAAVFETAVFDV